MTLPPGPSTPKALQGIRWIRSPLNFLESCRGRYGETFTCRFPGVGPMVFTSDPAAVKAIFSRDKDNNLSVGRSETLGPVMGPRSVLIIDGEEHMRRRKLILPAFHGERLRAYRDRIAGRTLQEVDSWPIGERFRMHPRMEQLTLDVILGAVLGLEEPSRLDRVRDLVGRLFALVDRPPSFLTRVVTRQLGRYTPTPEFLSLIEQLDAVIAEETARRRADPKLGTSEDILSFLIQARYEDGSAMDDADIRDQVMTLVRAGHATTAASLAFAFDLLLRDQAVIERLREEPEAGPFVDAVVRETLRLRPPIIGVGRELGSPVAADGHELPAGSNVFLAIYMAHTRPDLYPDPDAFRPQRFLNGAPDPYTWFPFGGGTRRCLGAGFAELEMQVVLRTALERATLRPATRTPQRMRQQNVVFVPEDGTPVVLEDRR